MSDVGEMYRAFRKENNEYKHKLRVATMQHITQLCYSRGISIKQHTAYHYRLSKNGIHLDVFPTNGRYHILATNERGQLIFDTDGDKDYYNCSDIINTMYGSNNV